MSFTRRIAAALLTLALAVGQADVCSGWMPTPEARMACCSEDGLCPMHQSESKDGPTRIVSQAEADRCCAASEHEDSAPSQSNAGFFLTLAVALSPIPALLPEPEPQPHIWRASVPISASHVLKHLLLSVFLV